MNAKNNNILFFADFRKPDPSDLKWENGKISLLSNYKYTETHVNDEK